MRIAYVYLFVFTGLFSQAHAETTDIPTGSKRQGMFLVDVAPLEFSGELGHQTYDLGSSLNGQDRKVGKQGIDGGMFYGGGLNLAFHFVTHFGLRAGVELGFNFGHMTKTGDGWDAASVNVRGRVAFGLGYQRRFGPVILHSETLAGFDYSGLEVTNPHEPPVKDGPIYALSRYSARLGQQVGIHFIVSEKVSLFVQGSVDIDGQYRASAGLGIINWR